MKNTEYISYCGVNCYECNTRTCAIKSNLPHCGKCGQFPCEELSDFYHSGSALRKRGYENMQKLLNSDPGANNGL